MCWRNGITFHIAIESDLNRIYEMFRDAIEDMEKKGIYQWDKLYPDKKILYNDMKDRQLMYAERNGVIVAAFVINRQCDAEYKNGKWKYTGHDWAVIHRLCVSSTAQNQGIGTKIMTYIEFRLREKGMKAVRLDAFTENPAALKMYHKLNYSIVGHADWRKGRFYLMEKIL